MIPGSDRSSRISRICRNGSSATCHACTVSERSHRVDSYRRFHTRSNMKRTLVGTVLLILPIGSWIALSAQPQRPQLADSVTAFVKGHAAVIVLTHARVIDGTGAPAKEDQTLIIRGGNIEAI